MSIVLFACVAACLVATMYAAYRTQRRLANTGWVDVFWTFGTGIGGAVCALAPLPGAPVPGARQILVGGLALLWSVRLGVYIARRVARSDAEDLRYRRFRREWGPDFDRRIFRFIMVQAPIAALLDLAVMVAARNPAPAFGAADALGAALLLLGIGGESVADWQMRRFRAAHPGGRAVCDAGLWAFSRHPNYVAEWLVWWAYPVIAIGAGGAFGRWPWSWLALGAPACMLWLLRYVSGVPPLEREMAESRGDAWTAYSERVPIFLPTGRTR